MTLNELACNYSLGQQQALSNKYPQKDTFIKKKFTPEKLKHMTNQEIRQFIEKSPYETVKLK